MQTSREQLWTASLLSLVLLAAVRPAFADQTADQIKVDWNDPEIKKFAQDVSNGVHTATVGTSQLQALKLPVLAFDSVPQIVKNAAPPGLQPTAPTRQVLMNDSDPTWYQINDQYGDVSISVAATLAVNHDVDKSTIYAPPADQSAPSDISVFDENGEAGFQGVIVEYTVYKYPDIPYTVTIECSGQAKDKCRDTAVVAKDKDLLKLISAQAPK